VVFALGVQYVHLFEQYVRLAVCLVPSNIEFNIPPEESSRLVVACISAIVGIVITLTVRIHAEVVVVLVAISASEASELKPLGASSTDGLSSSPSSWNCSLVSNIDTGLHPKYDAMRIPAATWFRCCSSGKIESSLTQ